MVLSFLIFAIALLYASVGQAGASGYLAVMALLGISPDIMRPTALVLNILVAGIATSRFHGAGHFSWPLLRPFALASAPLAILGGMLMLPSPIYRGLVGGVLWLAAFPLLRVRPTDSAVRTRRVPFGLALGCGAVIGLLSGLTGVGGGIFLSPLLLWMGWADMRGVAGVSAAFILINSIFALLGNLASIGSLPVWLPLWALCAAGGGWIGAELGSRWFAVKTLQRILAAILILAGLKMFMGR